MKYTLIVSDLDGTLANRGNISHKNLQAIKDAHSKGVKIWIATGRSPKNTQPIVDKLSFLGEDLKVICFNGAVAFTPHNKEIHYNVYFDHSIVKKIFSDLNDLKLSAWAYVVNPLEKDTYGLTTSKKGMTTRFLAKHNNSKGVVYKEETHSEIDSYKFIVSGKNNKIEEFKKRLEANQIKTSIYGSSYVGFNRYRNCIEVSPENVHKAVPLKILIDKEKIPQEKVVSIGDGSNDVELLKFAGVGVAMGNARKVAKEAADVATTSFSAHGFAKMVHDIVLKDE